MRIRIVHETRYRYEWPARGILQVLRMTPVGHEGQHVVSWRIEPDADGKLRPGEDALGNVVHTFSADEGRNGLLIRVSGEVVTQDTAGIVRGAVERAPDAYYLRETDLTAPDAAIRDLAATVGGQSSAPIDRLHHLLSVLHAEMDFDVLSTDAGTTAAQAFEMRSGVCQDITHVFLAAARHLGVPARYVSGYFHRADGIVDQEAGHAWAEAKIPGLGWVGFDPTNGISPTDAHVRVAVGLDAVGAAPVRGSRRGGGAEALEVKLQVDSARRQVQS